MSGEGMIPNDPDRAETELCWHIMTITRKGVVSLLRNLDAPTARAVYRKLRPNSRPIEEVNNLKEIGSFGWSMGYGRITSDVDIEQVEILGPEGANLDPWRGIPPLLQDMTETKRTGCAVFVDEWHPRC